MELLARSSPTLFVEYNVPAMTAAGFEPAELLTRIFDIYDTVFRIDEPRRVFRPVRPDEVSVLSRPHAYWNLIATTNPVHRELVQAIAADFAR